MRSSDNSSSSRARAAAAAAQLLGIKNAACVNEPLAIKVTKDVEEEEEEEVRGIRLLKETSRSGRNAPACQNVGGAVITFAGAVPRPPDAYIDAYQLSKMAIDGSIARRRRRPQPNRTHTTTTPTDGRTGDKRASDRTSERAAANFRVRSPNKLDLFSGQGEKMNRNDYLIIK